MWIVTIFAGMLLLFLANSFYTEYMQREIPWNANDMVRDAGSFHAFAAASELYMRSNASLPAGTNVTAATVMANATGLPAALSGASIDPNWKIRILAPGNYILCTSMSPGGALRMTQLPQSPLWNPNISWIQGNTTVSSGGTTVEMLTFDVSASDAQNCN